MHRQHGYNTDLHNMSTYVCLKHRSIAYITYPVTRAMITNTTEICRSKDKILQNRNIVSNLNHNRHILHCNIHRLPCVILKHGFVQPDRLVQPNYDTTNTVCTSLYGSSFNDVQYVTIISMHLSR